MLVNTPDGRRHPVCEAAWLAGLPWTPRLTWGCNGGGWERGSKERVRRENVSLEIVKRKGRTRKRGDAKELKGVKEGRTKLGKGYSRGRTR